jgi:hypothetical protein
MRAGVVRQTPWAAFVVLGALASPCMAQLAASAAGEDEIYAQIAEIEARAGPNSSELLDPFGRLGLLYEESGEHAFAIAAVQRSLQLVRFNNGLYSLDQAPFMQQLIRNEEQRGNHAAAWDLEQELLELVRRHPEDVRTVPILHEVADKQMAELHRYLDGERPPRVVLGCYYQVWPHDPAGNCNSGSRKDVVQGMIADAQRHYAEAIAVLLENELYAADELRELEMGLVRGAELIRSRYEADEHFRKDEIFSEDDTPVPMIPGIAGADSMEPWRSRRAPLATLAEWDLPYPETGSRADDADREHAASHRRIRDPYYRVRQSFERLYAYGVAGGAPEVARIDALVQMADWELLYSNNASAIKEYEHAYAMLVSSGAEPAAVDQFFAPSLPVVLPAFEPNPLRPDDTQATTGHIDVAFEITEYGRARKVEVLDAVNATDDARRQLTMLINKSRFRPRTSDGEFHAASRVVVRYYLH